MLEAEIVSEPTPVYPPHRVPHLITKRAVAGWVLYDLANTIFSMGVVSLYFSLWVRDQVGAQRADSTYGLITAFSMGIIFLVSPLLGAMTDRAPRRMPFLVASTLVCIVFTALLARAGYWATAACFVVANVAYQAGTQFYDAMLPEVSTEDNRGKVGGIGVGIGYLGSYLAVALGLKLGTADKPRLFLAIAIAFLLFSIPCFLFVRERGNPRPRPIGWAMVRDSTSQTVRTLKSGAQYPGLVRFLVGRVFYTDSINTVISIMALYTVNVAVSTGMNEAQGQKTSQFIMLFAITFAVAGGFFWGWLTDRLGPRRTLNYVLRAWMGVFALAGAVGILGLPLWCLFLVAASAGFSLGGVWASDRPYMLRLTPPSRVGEFYGLYGMVGRFSAITGPVLWAASTYVTIQLLHMAPRVGQGLSVIVLMGMIVASYLILQPISDAPREWKGADLHG
ncbi:MFS transporter [Longimicrobium sp.]|uniref:MFS transporter n=1 Tax=Longimicrobium sp. TaxID=2029185 RepID=UPI002CA1AB57|nr:MFS transporter [Longimicrobium sp.]HSU14622.1 MFS transporter [Longimicrobium sp.]